jgi:hypothetical protein
MMCLSLTMLGSLVKFAYLPIGAAIAVYVSFLFWRSAKSPRKLLLATRKDWFASSTLRKTTVLTVFVVSLGLFVQMYGINLVQYHNVTPQCGQVLGVQRCLSYGPWARNYQYAQQHVSSGVGNPAYFAGGWLYGMFYRSFFAINGPGGPGTYDNKPPLPIMAITAAGVCSFGLFLVWRYRRELFTHDAVLNFLLFVSGAYLIALLGRNYHDYLQLGHLVAINGRYLVLIILPVLLVIGMAYRRLLSAGWQGTLLVVGLALFLQGGGALSFIYDSNANWYWPNNETILRGNQHIQQVIEPFIISWPNS